MFSHCSMSCPWAGLPRTEADTDHHCTARTAPAELSLYYTSSRTQDDHITVSRLKSKCSNPHAPSPDSSESESISMRCAPQSCCVGLQPLNTICISADRWAHFQPCLPTLTISGLDQGVCVSRSGLNNNLNRDRVLNSKSNDNFFTICIVANFDKGMRWDENVVNGMHRKSPGGYMCVQSPKWPESVRRNGSYRRTPSFRPMGEPQKKTLLDFLSAL